MLVFSQIKKIFKLSKNKVCEEKIQDVKAEINRRIGMPFYMPLLAIIVCFLFSTNRETLNQNLYKYLIFAFAFGIIVISEILVRYSGKNYINNLIYYCLPALLIFLNYLILIKIFRFEKLKK